MKKRTPMNRSLFPIKAAKPKEDDPDYLPDPNDDSVVVDVEVSPLKGIKEEEVKPVSPYLSEVRVSPEVMEVCWSHALSNENQVYWVLFS